VRPHSNIEYVPLFFSGNMYLPLVLRKRTGAAVHQRFIQVQNLRARMLSAADSAISIQARKEYTSDCLVLKLGGACSGCEVAYNRSAESQE
jgi:hypothetical protein